MGIEVKICGVSTGPAMRAAIAGGARMVGFVFFPPSPRAIDLAEAVRLASIVPTGIERVGLFVDPTDDELKAAVATGVLDAVQLHGDETPERAGAVRALTGLPVIKALAVETAMDIHGAERYQGLADRLLFDARAPEAATRPGGNALSFDWSLLSGRQWPCPWFIAGGLTVDNLIEAVTVSGARAVDVSSGVEDAPGQKNVDKIRNFLRLASRL